jgi:hypothetical protein
MDNRNFNITNDYPEYYITPYTLLTVFSILWVSTAICRIMAMPIKLVFGVGIGIRKLIEGLLYLGGRTRKRDHGT